MIIGYLEILAGILLGLFLAEYLLRRYIWHTAFRNILEKSADTKISYTLKKNITKKLQNYQKRDIIYTTNYFGLRNRKIDLQKKRKRIICLGDSITFGFGVDEVDTYPRKIEKILKEKNKDIEVINSGIGAYNIIQDYYFLRNKLIKLNPDVVIIGLNISNLVEYFDWIYDDRKKTIIMRYPKKAQFKSNTKGPLNGKFSFIGKYLDQLYLFKYWLKPMLVRNQTEKPEFIGNKDILNHFNKYYSDEGIWKKRIFYLEKINKLCESRKIGLIYLVFPHTIQVELSNETLPQKQITRYLASQKARSIDILNVMKKQKNKPVSNLYFDDVHMTPEGLEIVAREAVNYLTKYFKV